MSHFDEMTCLLYLEGQLERPRARELSAHVEGCAECRALLRSLERESRWLAHALAEEEEAVPARLLAPPVRDAVPWAWIVSFGLAAAGAYTLWAGFIEPWRQQLSQAGFEESNLITMLFFGGVFWKGWGSMANLLQFLAMSTLGIVAFGLLRRRWRRWTTIAVVMSAVAIALALPPQTIAAEIHKGKSFVLAKGEVVKNDLIAGGQTVRIDGTVEGDLILFGRTLTVNGHVTGDVIGFGQFVRINGPVDGNVRVFANTLSLNAAVAKNVSAFAQMVEFDSQSQVGGGMMVFAGDATLDGRISRDLLGFIGKTSLNGYIGGSMRLRSDHGLTIGSSAEIVGKASYKGRREPEVSPGAKLASPLAVEITKRRPDYASPRFYWRQALKWGAAFLFGLATVLLMPMFFAEGVSSARRYGASFGFGALTLFATPIVAVIACLTIVGLALGIGAVLAWIVALYSAQLFVGVWLGETIMGAPTGTGALIGRLALGLALLRILTMLPYIGGWIMLVVMIWGMGALVLALYNRARRTPAIAPSAAAL